MSEPVAKPRTMVDLDEFERRLSRPSAASRTDGDPLAELARLVGGKQDPFDTVFEELGPAQRPADSLPPPRYQAQRNFPQPAATAPRTHLRAHPLAGDFAAIEAGLRGSIPPEGPDFSAGPRRLAARGPALEPPAGFEDTGLQAEWDEYAQPFPAAAAEAATPRSRRPLYITAVVIVVGLGGIGASFALKVSPGGPREIAMIKAANGPTKVQADNAIRAAQSDQNASILDKGPQLAPVALVDRAEQPVDLSGTALPQSTRPVRVMTIGSAQLAPGAANVPVPPPPGVAMPLGMGDLIEPRKVKTISVRPDGTLLTNDAPQASVEAPPPRPEPGQATAKASTPKAVARVVTTPKMQVASNRDADKAAARDRDETAASQDVSGASRIKSANSRSQPLKVAAAETSATDPVPSGSAKGSFSVQLAAPATEEEARESAARLGKQFADALNGRHLSFYRAEVGEKSVYRVRVGGLSREEATALCQKLQTSGGKCFVAKN
ncbi:MAG: SPOR domain-containing protein [Beijerinckiaceae bacterium]